MSHVVAAATLLTIVPALPISVPGHHRRDSADGEGDHRVTTSTVALNS